MQDREASLRRAKVEASLADGISWGISEDAIEEAEVGFSDYILCRKTVSPYQSKYDTPLINFVLIWTVL